MVLSCSKDEVMLPSGSGSGVDSAGFERFSALLRTGGAVWLEQ